MQMESILDKEGIAFEQNSVRSLARAADGSMRDGLSLLDQAIVHGGGSLEDGPVSAMLGTVSRKPVFGLLDALANGDAAALLQQVAELAEHSPNFADILQQLLLVLHHAALAQWVPDTVRHDDDAERIVGLAKRLSPEDLQLFYQIGLLGLRDLPLAPEPRGGFEMVLLRMLAFRPVGGGEPGKPSPQGRKPPAAQAPNRHDADTAKPATYPTHPNHAPRQAKPADNAVELAMEVGRNKPAPPGVSGNPTGQMPETVAARPYSGLQLPPTPAEASADWPAIIQHMHLSGLTLQLANHCILLGVDDNCVNLTLDPKVGLFSTEQLESNLEKGLQAYFQRPLKLNILSDKTALETPAAQILRRKQERQKIAEKEIEQDPIVLALKERLDARIVPGSIKPLD
jgi:DNA polymerase-3 subunit gamma/tau